MELRRFDIQLARICNNYVDAVSSDPGRGIEMSYRSDGNTQILVRKDESSGLVGKVVVIGREVEIQGPVVKQFRDYILEEVQKLKKVL